MAEAIERRKAYAASRAQTADARLRIARVHNAVAVLRAAFLPVSPDTITAVVDAYGAALPAADMLLPDVSLRLAAAVTAAIAAGGV